MVGAAQKSPKSRVAMRLGVALVGMAVVGCFFAASMLSGPPAEAADQQAQELQLPADAASR
ncbi:hypothetical protein ERY430_60058 [Erythrobacter sp. EC-HK427]|nr:hypothetical protein ERY430_60058 [Erythrobacter sp. EC-HK427]